MMFYAILIFIFLGFLIVIAIFFNEQAANKKLADKVIVHDEAVKKAASDIDKLNSENMALKTEIQNLLKIKEQMVSGLQERDELVSRYQTQGYNMIADRIDQTKLQEIMSRDVISVHVDAPFSEVARKMQKNDIRHLPVLDDDRKIVGIISQRMLYMIRSPRKLIDGELYYDEEILNDIILKNVMEKEVISLQAFQSVGKALMKMAFSKCGAIPIVDNENRLVGIVTRKDILKFAAEIYQHHKQ